MSTRREDPLADRHVVPGSIDSHFHAEVCRDKGLDILGILETVHGEGLAGALDISISPDSFHERLALLQDASYVELAIGAHPSETDRVKLEELPGILRDQARHPRVVALGEIGLDWYWDFATREAQRALFQTQLNLAEELDLPVVIHNREAGDDVAALLRASRPGRGGIMHCFSEGPDSLRRFLDMDMYVGFGGNITYKKSNTIRESARMVPESRLLLETDAPFLAPQAVRGRPNHPGYVGHTLAAIAELRNTTPERLSEKSTENYRRLTASGPSSPVR